jgi:hypothetical protein
MSDLPVENLGVFTVAAEKGQPRPNITWIRDAAGGFFFFKDDGDLFSTQSAEDQDEIVVLKARVRLKRAWIVAVRVLREWINEPEAADWTLGKMNDEAIYAATALEKKTAIRVHIDPH